jgi:serine/threonine-protein kinase
MNDEDEIISDKWFDETYDFSNGLGKVKLSRKYNFVNGNGQLISNQWFDNAENFLNGFAQIKLKNKYNFINSEGKLLWNKPIEQWFDYVWPFGEYGFGHIQLNKKENLINSKGQIVFTNWYDEITSKINKYGLIRVTLNGKDNLINVGTKQPINNQWFDYIDNNFYTFGFSQVKLNRKYNLIDKDGKLVSNIWFDDVYFGDRGIYHPIINGKMYNVDTNGNLTLCESKDDNSLPQLDESVKKYLTLLKEETVADGSSTSNPYKKRWKAEREALKNFVANYGELMQSKEDDKGGKLYKVFYDKTMSE